MISYLLAPGVDLQILLDVLDVKDFLARRVPSIGDELDLLNLNASQLIGQIVNETVLGYHACRIIRICVHTMKDESGFLAD